MHTVIRQSSFARNVRNYNLKKCASSQTRIIFPVQMLIIARFWFHSHFVVIFSKKKLLSKLYVTHHRVHVRYVLKERVSFQSKKKEKRSHAWYRTSGDSNEKTVICMAQVITKLVFKKVPSWVVMTTISGNETSLHVSKSLKMQHSLMSGLWGHSVCLASIIQNLFVRPSKACARH